MRVLEVLREAPIADISHVGDFSKNSSFRHGRDRAVVTHPASIENIKKKFGNTNQDINLIFVNTPQGGRETEVGEVGMKYVIQNLGEEVAKVVNKVHTGNEITVILTNNKGEQRFHMTPWIIAHRMMHVFARKGVVRSTGSNSSRVYGEFKRQMINIFLTDIMPAYGRSNMGNPDRVNYAGGQDRNAQLVFKHFFTKVCTFKSARDNKLRDWFEVFNELGAQYITTGNVKFNELPQSFGTTATGVMHLRSDDRHAVEHASDQLDMLSRDAEIMVDDLLGSALGNIFVM